MNATDLQTTTPIPPPPPNKPATATSSTAAVKSRRRAPSYRSDDLQDNINLDKMISAILLVIIAIFLPPVAVYIVAGCGADLLINICLTILGYFPGHIHAFYILYTYYNRKEQAQQGYFDDRPAPGVYSQNVQTGGQGYGTM